MRLGLVAVARGRSLRRAAGGKDRREWFPAVSKSTAELLGGVHGCGVCGTRQVLTEATRTAGLPERLRRAPKSYLGADASQHVTLRVSNGQDHVTVNLTFDSAHLQLL